MKITDKWIDKLVEVLYIQTNSGNEKLMVLFLDKELRRLKLNYTIDAAGNVLVTKGEADTYPCVVSHMDTVHKFQDNFTIYKNKDNNDELFSCSGEDKVGIGGDDKCGVFACLQLLKEVPCIKVVFFSREEIGCIGSTNINLSFFKNCRYIIQLDRKGNHDFIQTYLSQKTVSHNFSSEIGEVKKNYKYKNAVGTVTDVMKLWYRKVGISCINISAGYHNPHSANEYISISGLYNAIEFTKEIIQTMKHKKYTSFPSKVQKVTTYWTNNIGKRVQCKKCLVYKSDWLIKENGYCYECNTKINNIKTLKTTAASNSTSIVKTDDKNIISKKETYPYSCFECGISVPAMKKGEKLIQRNGHLYCSSCLELFEIPSEPTSCWICGNIIKENDIRVSAKGQIICVECAAGIKEASELDGTL